MYSKLGGCLGVTAKLGPYARTDLWAGVKGLLDRLMTHLGLGSSLEEPWLDLPGGMGVGLPSWEVELTSWEGWVGLCLGVPITLPACPGGVMTLPCPGGARGMRGAVSLTVCTEGRSLGWANIFQGKVWSSGERTASFPGRKVSSCRTWCLESGSTVPFWGRVYSYWGRIASFPGRKVSNCRTRETVWCLDTGRAVTFWGRVYSCRGRIASLPGREVSNGRCGEIAYDLTCRVGLTAHYLTVTFNPFARTGKYRTCGKNTIRYLNRMCKLSL